MENKTKRTYGELLSENRVRIKSIEIKSIDNDRTAKTAVVQVILTSLLGEVFEATGHASPDNLEVKFRPFYLATAETRAKARALRDFAGIGEPLAEEFEGMEGAVSPTALTEGVVTANKEAERSAEITKEALSKLSKANKETVSDELKVEEVVKEEIKKEVVEEKATEEASEEKPVEEVEEIKETPIVKKYSEEGLIAMKTSKAILNILNTKGINYDILPGKNTNAKLRNLILADQEGELDSFVEKTYGQTFVSTVRVGASTMSPLPSSPVVKEEEEFVKQEESPVEEVEESVSVETSSSDSSAAGRSEYKELPFECEEAPRADFADQKCLYMDIKQLGLTEDLFMAKVERAGLLEKYPDMDSVVENCLNSELLVILNS